jgi:PPE-repeat protein
VADTDAMTVSNSGRMSASSGLVPLLAAFATVTSVVAQPFSADA